MKPKILHFPGDFTANEISKILEKRNDVLYYTRQINENEFHLVKNNESSFFKVFPFETQLLKFYESNKDFKDLIKGIKLKGNDNFSIIENASPELIEKLKKDFNKLLIK